MRNSAYWMTFICLGYSFTRFLQLHGLNRVTDALNLPRVWVLGHPVLYGGPVVDVGGGCEEDPWRRGVCWR